MWQELPWASGKLSQEEYESRRNLCTEHSVRSLASDPVFLGWLDSKRQDLQRRKQQALRRRRSWLTVFLTLALLAISGAFVYHRHDLATPHLPTIRHLSSSSFPSAGSLRPARYLRSVSDLAQPLLDHAKPGPYLAAANSRLLPVYQQVASSLSAGIIQLPSLAPHSAQHEATPSQPSQAEPMPSSILSQAAASSSASAEATHASQSEGSSGNGLVPARSTLLHRMGGLSPVKSIARVPGRVAKSLQSISKHVLLALPSRTSPAKKASNIPTSVMAQSYALGNPSPDGLEDVKPTSAHHEHVTADNSSPGLLQRVNRSSTSLAVYIARMPMRTAKTWGHITKQTLLALPAANYLSLYKPFTHVVSANESQAAESTLEPVMRTSPSATKLAVEQGDTAESAAETTLLGRFNRSSKPLANLIARLPAQTSQGLRALSRQTLLALPAANPASNGSAQDGAGAASPAIIDAAASETQEAAVTPEHQVRNDAPGPTAASATSAQLDAGTSFDPSATDNFSAANGTAEEPAVKAARSRKVGWAILAVLLFILALAALAAIGAADNSNLTKTAAASGACPQAQAQKRTQQAAIAFTTQQPQSAPRKRSRTDPSPKRGANMAEHLGKPRVLSAASGHPEAKETYTVFETSSLYEGTAVSATPGSPCFLSPSIAASCPATASPRPVPCTSDAAAQQPSSPVQDPAQVLEVPTFIAPAQIHVDNSSYATIERSHDAHVLESTGEGLGALLTEGPLSLAPPDLDASSGASSSSLSIESIEGTPATSAQIVAQAADGATQLQHDAASDMSEEDLEEAPQSTAVALSESESSSDDDAGSHTSEVDGFVVVEA